MTARAKATRVDVHLGLDEGLDSEVLAEAAAWDREWVSARPELSVVPDGLAGLRAWTREAPFEDTDRVLGALAFLAARDGGDDQRAASALMWAMLGAATLMAARLSRYSPRIGELVATQLWLEVRTVDWSSENPNVPGRILSRTRRAVMSDCGAQPQNSLWARTASVDADVLESLDGAVINMATAPEPGEDPAREVLDLLEWACGRQVITRQDRALLISLTLVADGLAHTGKRDRGGLCGDRASAVVGAQMGLSAQTVRRRAKRSLEALGGACAAADWGVPA